MLWVTKEGDINVVLTLQSWVLFCIGIEWLSWILDLAGICMASSILKKALGGVRVVGKFTQILDLPLMSSEFLL